MTLRCERWLADAAAAHPARVAIVRGDRRVEYSALHDESERFAAALATAGLVDGERCVVFLENSVEAAVGVFGTLRAGGVFSLINPTTKADKLAFVLGDCGASVLLTQASLLPVAMSAAGRSPSLRRIVVVDGDGDGTASTVGRWATRTSSPPASPAGCRLRWGSTPTWRCWSTPRDPPAIPRA